MNFSLLALSDNCAERGFLSSCHELRGVLEQFGSCRLEYYGGIQELFAGVVEGLSNSEAVVVAVSPRHYVRCKKKLIQALGIPMVKEKTVYGRICERVDQPLTEEQRAVHSAVPTGAEVFLSPDGLYSGFAVESDGQHIVFVSTEGKRLGDMMERELIPYFARISDHVVPNKQPETPEEKEPEAEQDGTGAPHAGMVPVSLPPAPDPGQEDVQRDLDAEPDPVGMARNAIAVLLQKKGTLAVAQSKTSGLVQRFAEQAGIPDGTVFFSDHRLERGRENPRDYIARLAMAVRDQEDADYGAAITNVFTTGADSGEMFLYIAVADEAGAYVRRLYLEQGEKPEHFIQAAVCALFESVEQTARFGTVRRAAGKAPVVVAPDPDEGGAMKMSRLSKKTKIIIGACVSVLVLVCIIMGFCLRTPSVSAFNAEDTVDSVSYCPPLSEPEAEPAVEEPSSSEETSLPPATQAETEKPDSKPPQKPKNDPKEAGGVGGGIAEKPVIEGDGGETPEPGPPSGHFSGTFTITTYGYGHGVGMSQYGANEFAKENWTFDRILLHYYPGTSIVSDSMAGTEGIPSADDIARVVQQEMGPGFETEALKAQAVAAYSYARSHGNSINGMSSVSDISMVSDKVRSAVGEVYGKMLAYGGQPINAVFHAMSAGTTAAAQTVWGGSTPYLQPVSSPGDLKQQNYKVTRTYTAQEMADILNSAFGVSMSGDPSGWLTILQHDSAVSAEIGYVQKMRIQINAGTYTDISGNYFRENVMGYSRMRSPCFTVTYTP